MLNKESLKTWLNAKEQKIRTDVSDCILGMCEVFINTLKKYNGEYNITNLIECCEITIENQGEKSYSNSVLKSALKLLLQYLFDNKLIEEYIIDEVVNNIDCKSIVLKNFILDKCFFHLDDVIVFIKNATKQIGNNSEDSLMLICWCVFIWYFLDNNISEVKKSDCNDKKHTISLKGVVKCIPQKHYKYIKEYKSLIHYCGLTLSDKKSNRTLKKSRYLFRTDKCIQVSTQNMNSIIRNFNNTIKLLSDNNKKSINLSGIKDSRYYYTIYSYECVEGSVPLENFVKHYQHLLTKEGITVSIPTFYNLKQGYPIWKNYLKK